MFGEAEKYTIKNNIYDQFNAKLKERKGAKCTGSAVESSVSHFPLILMKLLLRTHSPVFCHDHSMVGKLS